MSENNKKSKYNFASISMKTSAILLSSLMLMQSVPFANLAKAEEEVVKKGIYKPASTYDYKIKRDDLTHVGLTSFALYDQGTVQKEMPYVNRYAKIMPLNDENYKFEQDWIAVFNMGMHQELLDEIKKDPNRKVDPNNIHALNELFNDLNMPYTSNPWFSILLSKDLSVVGDFEFYVINPQDDENNGKYVLDFNEIASRIAFGDPKDKFFVAPKVTKSPSTSFDFNITDITETNEKLSRYATLSLNGFDREWTNWAFRFMERDGIQVFIPNEGQNFGEDSFELKNLSVSNNDEIQNKYNAPVNGKIQNTWGDSNKSVGHFLLNDLGYGMRFRYDTDNTLFGTVRVAVKFRTKRNPMDFFKDEKWNMVRRDTDTQMMPFATFVAANYKSYDDGKVRQQVDVAVPKSVFEDADSDNLRDYYEKLLGTLTTSDDTDADTKKELEELNTNKDLKMPVQGKGELTNKEVKGHLIKDLTFENTTDGTTNKFFVPKVDKAASKGMSKIYGEDPAVGAPEFDILEADKEDNKLIYRKGATVTGTTAPFATVGLYIINEQGERELNPAAETIADKDGKFVLVLGNVLTRETSLNKYGNDIKFVSDRTPVVLSGSEEGLKTLKGNKNQAKIYITSEGTDERPAFLLPYADKNVIELTEPRKELTDEEKKARIKEAL